MRVYYVFCLVFATLVTITTNFAAADDGCASKAADIVRQAYPNVYEFSENGFRLNVENGPNVSTANIYEDSPQTYDVFCRVWPANPDLMLVAIPIIREMSNDGTVGDLDLLVLDAKTLQIRQRLLLEDEIQSDAVYISGMAFDTAHYLLAPDQLAFGFRISKTGSSRVFPFGETRLTLFIIDGQDLRAVLRNALVSQGRGEWDGDCISQYSETAY